MAYVLKLGRAWAGETAEQIAARLGGAEQEEEVAPDPAEIRRVRAVVEGAMPGLQPLEVPKGWTLTHPGSRAQIRMSADEFTITVPSAFSAGTARTVWGELWRVLQALNEEGYATYDAQLGRILHPSQDFEAVIDRYSGPEKTTRVPTAAPASKPWWKFW